MVTNKIKKTSALVWKENELYVAKSLEVEVASQGKTKVEALTNLKEALELYFEKEISTPKPFPYKDLSLEKLNIAYA